MTQQTFAYFKGLPNDMLTLLAAVDIGINPAHAVPESDSLWRVNMNGDTSIDPAIGGRVTSRIDVWLGSVIRSAQTGVDGNGDPIITTVDRGRHITLRVWGPYGDAFRESITTAYRSAAATTEDHDSPQGLLTRFGATVRKTRVAFGLRLISISPPESWDPDDPTNSALLTDLYAPIQFPHHRFA